MQRDESITRVGLEYDAFGGDRWRFLLGPVFCRCVFVPDNRVSFPYFPDKRIDFFWAWFLYSTGRIGPDVCSFACDHGPNEKWKYTAATQTLENLEVAGQCLTLSNGIITGAGAIWTQDAAGRKWALTAPGGQMDNPSLIKFNGSALDNPSTLIWKLNGKGVAGPGFSADFGGSGPLPHTRWLVPGSQSYTFAHNVVGGSTMRPVGAQVIDDDHIGHVVNADGADFCMDARPAGNLEVWHAPLVGGKHAVAVINRSPARNQSVTVKWEMFGVAPAQRFSLREAWSGAKVPKVHGSYIVAGLDQRASALLILTPTSAT